MNEVALLQNYLVVGGLLFAIGLVGFMTRRNTIVMFIALEMMMQGVAVSLVAWSRFHNDFSGQMLVIMIIAVAACEAAIALSLILMLARRSSNLDIAFWQLLREEGQEPTLDEEVPAAEIEHEPWPELTPAGVEPELDPEKVRYRSHV
ncbi:MAG: NADH-quinone oxidoreductase subunit NuoK [Planctomycetota bacterium]|nr:MAG: NADH-quinone oxidoreductase subunit NuoK [Planctomycetota bacterium]REJ91365.1 MAG: NADH-quinone oxidoreductase subunit NuoK [Planctomycetota bacterium]REK18515.1 MAG: NADH-quinone oxidoreductase subunit NuoK [Planctomycetota bacterium]REK39425.1 MAG: NADH-quinone oxidoreductase subunit NuoK [Planctomycetota bacterium]